MKQNVHLSVAQTASLCGPYISMDNFYFIYSIYERKKIKISSKIEIIKNISKIYLYEDVASNTK